MEEAELRPWWHLFSEAASSAAAAADIRLEKEGAEAAAAPNGSPTPPEEQGTSRTADTVGAGRTHWLLLSKTRGQLDLA